VGEGISGRVGKLSFANLLGWRGGTRVHSASANGSRTASEHIV
jgi:hypothetical protein